MLPKSRPQASLAKVMTAARKQWHSPRRDEPLPDVFLLGIRGYYRDTMGEPGKNDRGIYDDAIFIVSPDVLASFNANVDPSRFKPGIASLLNGFYPYRLGNHGISKPGGGYPALRPATKNEELPVRRDGEDRVPSARPGVAINIHRGSISSTSSEGCQTIHPSQWEAFHSMTKTLMANRRMRTIWYGLTDGPI